MHGGNLRRRRRGRGGKSQNSTDFRRQSNSYETSLLRWAVSSEKAGQAACHNIFHASTTTPARERARSVRNRTIFDASPLVKAAWFTNAPPFGIIPPHAR